MTKGRSFPNVMAQREILVSAMMDDICEEIYRQTKTPPLNFHDEIKKLCNAIEAKQAPHLIDLNGQLYKDMRDAATRVIAKLCIMSLDL